MFSEGLVLEKRAVVVGLFGGLALVVAGAVGHLVGMGAVMLSAIAVVTGIAASRRRQIPAALVGLVGSLALLVAILLSRVFGPGAVLLNGFALVAGVVAGRAGIMKALA